MESSPTRSPLAKLQLELELEELGARSHRSSVGTLQVASARGGAGTLGHAPSRIGQLGRSSSTDKPTSCRQLV